VASLKTVAALRTHLAASGIPLELDDRLAAPAESPLAQPIDVDGVRVGNRFCILPMEGWDGTADGEPSELTRRRWRNFGISGAKLIWGGEAVAVRHDGRANPNQLLLVPRTQKAIASLRDDLVSAHRERFGAAADGDLHLGLQLTHSGRFSKPNTNDRPEPLPACPHPALDRRFPDGVRVLSDGDLDRLVDEFIAAARLAWDAGYAFVDVKACHGYLGHDLLGARAREGAYGGPIENRTRFMRRIIEGIRAELPRLGIVVRLSAFDVIPSRRASTTASACSWMRISTAHSMTAARCFACWTSSASAGCVSPQAARTTTRTSSGRRCFRRSTATNRPRIRSAGSRARSRRRRG
jgi:2,4-dienoyl-CoA reductase-like NADH-dependent reductase (Old Yellow Enzyme family)